MGHVPPGPVREARQGDDLPRRQHRGARADDGDLAASGHPDHRRNLGSFGESVALRVLLDHGASLIGRNVEVAGGEIDLHVAFGTTVVAVEVKTLAVDDPARSDPLRSYTDEKADQVHRLARKLRPPADRVDVMAVAVHRGGVDVRWVRAA